MSNLMLVGLLLGAIVGMIHAAQFIAARVSGPGGALKTVWHAVWIVALWTVFGPYVLAIWLVGAVLLALSHVVSTLRADSDEASEVRS